MNDREIANERLFESVADVLEHMMIKKHPPEEQIRQIRFRYPSPTFFIQSNEHMLKQAGLGNTDAFYFWMIPGLTRYTMREGFGQKPCLNTVSKMVEYLKALYIGIHVECFYAVLLDTRGRVIKTILVGKGTVDSAPFDMGLLLSLVVQHGAKALVLCHNHPHGSLRPSQEDINCTLRAMAATVAIGVPLLDHIIIANHRAVSMRDCGCIHADLWVMQGPKKKLVRDWLDVDLLQ